VVSVSDPMIKRSEVQLRATPLSGVNSGQVVHTPQPVDAMPQFANLSNQKTCRRSEHLWFFGQHCNEWQSTLTSLWNKLIFTERH